MARSASWLPSSVSIGLYCSGCSLLESGGSGQTCMNEAVEKSGTSRNSGFPGFQENPFIHFLFPEFCNFLHMRSVWLMREVALHFCNLDFTLNWIAWFPILFWWRGRKRQLESGPLHISRAWEGHVFHTKVLFRQLQSPLIRLAMGTSFIRKKKQATRHSRKPNYLECSPIHEIKKEKAHYLEGERRSYSHPKSPQNPLYSSVHYFQYQNQWRTVWCGWLATAKYKKLKWSLAFHRETIISRQMYSFLPWSQSVSIKNNIWTSLIFDRWSEVHQCLLQRSW